MRFKGKLKQIIDDHVASVVLEALARYGVHAGDFRAAKVNRAVRARSWAIRKLHQDGFTKYLIGQVLKIDGKTVRSRFNPAISEKSNLARRKLYAKRKAEAGALKRAA